MARLTQMQEAFCLEYYRTGNATQSAITAGYSQLTAQEQSSRMLSKVMVIERMAQLNAPVLKLAESAKAKQLKRAEAIADSDQPDRTRGLDIWSKLTGSYAPEQHEILSVNRHTIGYERVERKD